MASESSGAASRSCSTHQVFRYPGELGIREGIATLKASGVCISTLKGFRDSIDLSTDSYLEVSRLNHGDRSVASWLLVTPVFTVINVIPYVSGRFTEMVGRTQGAAIQVFDTRFQVPACNIRQ